MVAQGCKTPQPGHWLARERFRYLGCHQALSIVAQGRCTRAAIAGDEGGNGASQFETSAIRSGTVQ